MRPVGDVAAHLILGARDEPFLSAMLASIADAATLLIVNDNSYGDSPHATTLATSRFGQEGRLVVDRTPFGGFAAARNICLRLHEELAAGNWAVSYTHLDVYKRQDNPISRSCTAPSHRRPGR